MEEAGEETSAPPQDENTEDQHHNQSHHSISNPSNHSHNHDDSNDNDENDDDDEMEDTTRLRAMGADGGRILSNMTPERRQRLLWRILFERYRNRASRRRPWQREESDDESPVRPPIRVLGRGEAERRGVTCRFCLGTASDDDAFDDDDDDNAGGGGENPASPDRLFVAPCSCTGTAEHVHVGCLRRWQLEQPPRGHSHASFCGVCRSPYSLRPPRLRDHLVPAGSLLVHAGDPEGAAPSSSFFGRSVVLVLEGSDSDCPLGIVLNKPLCCDPSWRQGGPVCGGRMGVWRFLVAHTLGPGASLRNDDDNDGGSRESRYYHREVLPGLFVVYETESHQPFLSERQFEPVADRLRANAAAVHNDEEADEAAGHGEEGHDRASVLVFAGYCRWSRHQLRDELLRGAWSIHPGPIRPADLLTATSRGTTTTTTTTPPGNDDDSLWRALRDGKDGYRPPLARADWYEFSADDDARLLAAAAAPPPQE